MSKHDKNNCEGKKGLRVDVKDGNVEAALRVLKKKVMQEGLIRDLRKHEYYEKPSVRKRREAAKAKKRIESNNTNR